MHGDDGEGLLRLPFSLCYPARADENPCAASLHSVVEGKAVLLRVGLGVAAGLAEDGQTGHTVKGIRINDLRRRRDVDVLEVRAVHKGALTDRLGILRKLHRAERASIEGFAFDLSQFRGEDDVHLLPCGV